MQLVHHTPIQASGIALGTFLATAMIALVAFFAAPAFAGDSTADAAAKAQYLKDRANCDAGKTAEDKATCLKEAGAAESDRKRHQLNNDGSTAQNATDRCKMLPAKDKADCMARVKGSTAANQTTTKSGSVAGGGIIEETTTTTTGPAIVVPVPAASTPR